MAVRDPHRDSGLFRGHEREHADRVHMGVHDARVNLLEQFPAGVRVLDWVAVWRNVEHSTAQGLDLVLGNHRRVSLYDEIELHLGTVDMAVMVHHGGLDTTAHHPADYLGYSNRHWITDLEPGLSRHNGRYRLFLQSIDLWSACESRPFPLNEPRIGVSQEQPKPRRSYPIPFTTCQGRFLHPPQTPPAPVTYFGGILHRFSMNALLARDLKTVFEI